MTTNKASQRPLPAPIRRFSTSMKGAVDCARLSWGTSSSAMAVTAR